MNHLVAPQLNTIYAKQDEKSIAERLRMYLRQQKNKQTNISRNTNMFVRAENKFLFYSLHLETIAVTLFLRIGVTWASKTIFC